MDKIFTYINGDKTTRKSMNITYILTISFFIGVVLATNASAVMNNWMLDINANSTDTVDNILESTINFGINTIATNGYDGAPFDIDAAPIPPTGFDLRFIEPGVSTGELTNDTKAVGESKSWTLLAQAPRSRKINITWFFAKIPVNVEMQIQEIDLNTGSPIGLPINMKLVNLISFTAGTFSNLQKGYIITATAGAVKGDINGNGQVTLVDAIYLAKHVGGFSGYETIYADGDINANGQVTLVDAIYLAKHVGGFIGYEKIY